MSCPRVDSFLSMRGKSFFHTGKIFFPCEENLFPMRGKVFVPGMKAFNRYEAADEVKAKNRELCGGVGRKTLTLRTLNE
jgi:hypothetical protein